MLGEPDGSARPPFSKRCCWQVAQRRQTTLHCAMQGCLRRYRLTGSLAPGVWIPTTCSPRTGASSHGSVGCGGEALCSSATTQTESCEATEHPVVSDTGRRMDVFYSSRHTTPAV